MTLTRKGRAALAALRRQLRPASIARVGGFRPPNDPLVSWVGRGCLAAGEALPHWEGAPMAPLIQIRTAALPVPHPALAGTAMLTLFHRAGMHPFGAPHGEGWLIREHRSLDGLEPIPGDAHPRLAKPLPIRWEAAAADAPGWEDAGELVDLDALDGDQAAAEAFFERLPRHDGTKVGGFPTEIQHGAGDLDGFVFQLASEPKAGWQWGDNGVAHFFRAPDGTWRWDCQSY